MPPAKGYQYIVLAQDDLSKYVEGRALQTASARAVAMFVLEDLILCYGCIGKIVIDNGPEFKGTLSDLLKQYSIPQVYISPYNSQANGVVEQWHYAKRSLGESLQGCIHLWPNKLQMALFADNITIRRSTGYSAYFLLHGTNPILPPDLWEFTFLVEGFQQNLPSQDLLALRIQQIEYWDEDMANAMQILRNSQLKSKCQFERWFEAQLAHGRYAPGDLILVRNTAIEKELNRKTKPRYLGPYKVIRQTLGENYVVEELDGATLARPMAAFRVVPYITCQFLEQLSHKDPKEEPDSETKSELEVPKNADEHEWNLIELHIQGTQQANSNFQKKY